MTDPTNSEPNLQREQERAHRWRYYQPYLFHQNDHANDLAGIALKSVILLNGAAAIALLAFVGQVWGRDGGVAAVVGRIIPAIKEFVLGAFAGSAATGLGYLAVYFYAWAVHKNAEDGNNAGKSINIIGRGLHILAVVFVVYAFLRFGIGMSVASSAFLAK